MIPQQQKDNINMNWTELVQYLASLKEVMSVRCAQKREQRTPCAMLSTSSYHDVTLQRMYE
jgi:hypothetical protein